MRIALAFALLLMMLAGCQREPEPVSSYTGKVLCGKCGRTIYHGKINVYRGGFQWPEGEMNHCKPNDPLCVELHP